MQTSSVGIGQLSTYRQALEAMWDLDVVGENDPEFGKILSAICDAMREFVPGEWADAPDL